MKLGTGEMLILKASEFFNATMQDKKNDGIKAKAGYLYVLHFGISDSKWQYVGTQMRVH